MAKLKALRGQVGTYGHVAKHGIVEVDDNEATRLLKKGNFVKATSADVAAAKKRMDEFAKVNMTGTIAGFAPMPDLPTPALSLEEQAAARAAAEAAAAKEAAEAAAQAEADKKAAAEAAAKEKAAAK